MVWVVVCRVVGVFFVVVNVGQKGGFPNMGGSSIACRSVGGSTLALVIVLGKPFAGCHSRPLSSALCAATTLSCAARPSIAIVCVVLMVVVVINVIVIIVSIIVVVHV